MKYNNELIVVKGINHGDKLPTRNSSQLNKHVTYAYDGYRLDELNIAFNIKSAADINYLISDLAELKVMLEMHKPCFMVGGVDVNLLK